MTRFLALRTASAALSPPVPRDGAQPPASPPVVPSRSSPSPQSSPPGSCEGGRAAYFSGRSIAWERVHRLPDYVFFDHGIHVNKGIGFITCHGRVDLMPAIEQVAPLTME